MINEKETYLPKAHMRKLLCELNPALRFDGSEDVYEWQKKARAKLYDLLGIDEIKKFACDDNLTVDYDRINEDGTREIRFRFLTEEGVIAPAHLLLPAGAVKPPVVICLQGHATGMHISLGRAKFPGDEEDIIPANGDRNFAVRAVEEGVAALALDQRCFGECGGSEKGPDCTQASLRSFLLGRTMVGERVWDVMNTINMLEKYFSDLVDLDRVMCLGNSGGGTTTIYAAAMDERIKIAVPSCAMCTWVDSIANMYHCECNYVAGIANYFDMGDLVGLIAPRGLVAINGEKDMAFMIEGAKECFEIGKKVYKAMGAEDKCYHVIGEGGHRFYADASWPTIQKLIKEL